jgi:hypothetical protein
MRLSKGEMRLLEQRHGTSALPATGFASKSSGGEVRDGAKEKA